MYAWLHDNSSVIFDAAGDGYVAMTAAVGADCWLSPARALPDRGRDEDDRAPELAQEALHVEGDQRVVLDQEHLEPAEALAAPVPVTPPRASRACAHTAAARRRSTRTRRLPT